MSAPYRHIGKNMMEDGKINLNVKSGKARRLATALAKATGETVTAAVTRAIEERLARVVPQQDPAEMLLTIGEDCARRLKSRGSRAPWATCSMMNTGCRRDRRQFGRARDPAGGA